MIAGCVDDRGILSATSTPRPRPGVGGRGDRRADVWRVGRCDRGMLPGAVVRRLCGLCRGVCGRYLCASRVRWTRFAPPAASKPSAVASKDEARSRPRYGTALCTASIVHSGLCTARRRDGAVHSRPLGCTSRRRYICRVKSWVRTFRLRVVLECTSTMRIIIHKTEHTCAPAHIPRSTKTSITKLPAFGLAVTCTVTTRTRCTDESGADAKMRNRACRRAGTACPRRRRLRRQGQLTHITCVTIFDMIV